MAEVIRCSECGTPFKGVPSWLGNAKVNFTCTSCPKKGTRGMVRMEPAIESHASIDLEGDSDEIDIDSLEEDADLELADEDLESLE